MLRVLYIMRLRLKLLLSNKRMWLSFIFLPLMAVAFLYYFYENTLEEARIPVAVVDEDRSEYSGKIVEKLLGNSTVQVVKTEAESLPQLVMTNQVDVGIIIPAGFQEEIANGKTRELMTFYQSTSSMATPFVQEMMASEVMRFISNHAAADRVIHRLQKYGVAVTENVWLSAWEYTDDQWEPTPLMTIDSRELVNYEFESHEEKEANDASSLKEIFSLAAAFLMLFTFFVNHWALEDRQLQLQRRLELFDVKVLPYFLGNCLGTVIVSIIQLVLLLGLMSYKVPGVATHFFPVLGLSLLYVVFCSFLGTWIATWSSTKKTAGMIGIGVVGITSIVAVGMLPSFNGYILFPQHWFIEGVAAIVTGLSPLPNMIYLLVLSLGCFVVSFLSVRWNYARRT